MLLLFGERRVRNLRLLSRAAETAARLRVEYPERSPSHSSYIWDREIDGPEDVVVRREPLRRSDRVFLNFLLYIWGLKIDGPEDVVVRREPVRRSGREYLNFLLRAGLWTLFAYVFVDIVIVGTKPRLDLLNWHGYLGLSLIWALYAVDPHARQAILTFFQVLRQGPPGGGPQRPAAA